MNFPNTDKLDDFGVPSQQPVSATKQYGKIILQMHVMLLIDMYFKFSGEFLFSPCLEIQLVNDSAVSSKLLHA